MAPKMDPEGKCARCGDWARDCICEEDTDICEHARVEFNRAEPDLGYSAYYQCLDCDATTTEWVRDGDEDGEWIEPVWED